MLKEAIKRKRANSPGRCSQNFSVLMMLGNYSVAAHRGIARFAIEHDWDLNADMAHVPILPWGWSGNGIITGLAEWEEPIRFLESLAAKRIPIVDIFNIRNEITLPRVVGDNEKIGQLAAQYFLKGGWRRFAWFSRVNNNASETRQKAYEKTLLEAGFESQRLGTQAVDKGSWQAIQWAVLNDIRAFELPMAVFCYNDYDASFIQNACNMAGLSIPDEVSVLGVDNNPLAVDCLPVKLSSIRHDLETVGYEGAALLHHLMMGGRAPKAPQTIAPLGIAERASTETVPVEDPLIRRVLTYMKKNITRKFSVTDLRVITGVSRRSLETSFKRETGRTIMEQLNVFRAQEARKLLSETKLPVAQIAQRLGFCSPPHLHRVFKDHFQMTPFDWRSTI